jgi:hypothetical protein
MWKVPETDCARSFAWNAVHVLAVRVAEVYAHAGSLDNPAEGQRHHDLRISLKRLRYSLEFFAACYDPLEVASILDSLSTMQDLLGDLHDADVLIPELQQTYAQLANERRRAVRGVGVAARGGRTPMSFEAFEADLGRAWSSPAQAGILTLINRLRRQRRASYRAAVELWRSLHAGDFRERLERLGRVTARDEQQTG